MLVEGGTVMEGLQQATGEEWVHRPHILLVEDELSVGKGIQMVLTEDGYSVDLAMTGLDALTEFTKKEFDLMVADLRLPDIDGMDVIKQVKGRSPEVEVIVITGYSTVSSAVNAMKLGAFDYLPKPFTDDEIKGAVKGALKRREQALMQELPETEAGELIQKKEVIRVLEKAAEQDDFWVALHEKGSEALRGYQLTSEAKAAIVSGDINWLRQNVGELTDKQLSWIHSRLEMERW
jgi:DNA-binding response OmpR family regulator